MRGGRYRSEGGGRVKRTPLHDEHVALGARMVEFAGWSMPVQYDGIVNEHLRVRRAAGLFDVSHMGELEVSGPDAEACLARLLANDVRRLAPGRAQYSLIPNASGGVVDDVIVYRLEPERFMICLNAANADKDVAWIEGHAEGDCEIRDVSDDRALLALQGPAAGSILADLCPQADGLARFGCCHAQVGGADILVARTGYTGEDGFELFVRPEHAVALWRTLLASQGGAAAGAIGLGARDTLRLEAALPLYGHELDEDISPFEAGLAWVVKLDREHMVGYASLREASERPSRRLVGLEVSGGIARQGCSVLASGTEIGMVTSGSYCPAIEKAVALALVASDGSCSDLAVEVRGKGRPATATDIPFYVRQASTT